LVSGQVLVDCLLYPSVLQPDLPNPSPLPKTVLLDVLLVEVVEASMFELIHQRWVLVSTL
jgi:hypothetical protein